MTPEEKCREIKDLLDMLVDSLVSRVAIVDQYEAMVKETGNTVLQAELDLMRVNIKLDRVILVKKQERYDRLIKKLAQHEG